MRRRLCALMMTLTLLAGCGGGGEVDGNSADELALAIRAEFLAMNSCTATVEITADYGQRVFAYTVELSWQKEGETLLRVTAPEQVAGVTGRIAKGSTYLEYDGASLETGPLTGDGLSPMEAVPAVLEDISSGYMAESGFETAEEGERLYFLCREPEATPGTGIEGAFWFDAASHALLRAELRSDGYTVITCVFTNFTKE